MDGRELAGRPSAWPLFDAALWLTWRGLYAMLAALVVAVGAPVLAVVLWPAFATVGVGPSVLMFAMLAWGTRETRRRSPKPNR